ncbi:MAG: hypothetical protein JWL83_1542 [Actinomycetia bacterium]|nr:hypothetical protein [Actinomycetes bacterium]
MPEGAGRRKVIWLTFVVLVVVVGRFVPYAQGVTTAILLIALITAPVVGFVIKQRRRSWHR